MDWEKSEPSSTIWTFPNDYVTPCTQLWQGLVCAPYIHNSTDCYITSIDLANYKLSGRIPKQIGNLTKLESLKLYSNQLYDAIPTELGLLMAMQELNLFGNNLNGRIPTELGLLTVMQILYLYDNSLTGPIPTELGFLTAMQDLYLYDNSLNGTIPTEIGKLSAIQILYISNNKLTGTIPTQLGRLSAMEQLFLTSNSLIGFIPTEFGKLLSMLTLYANANNFNGSIPAQLGNLLTMHILDLDTNSLTGVIPTEFGKLSNLIQLSLYTNSLVGSIPTQLGQLTKLQSLDLQTNALNGSIPSELGRISGIQQFFLNGNKLTGSIPVELGNLFAITNLALDRNCLEGLIPTQLGQLSLMQTLSLDNNKLNGSISIELCQMKRLTQLFLYNNRMTGCIPSEIGQLTAMQQLYLQNNELIGIVPSELGLLTVMQAIYLSSNRFTGTLPKELGQLLAMQALYLFDNCLIGSIPTSFGNLSALQVLSVFGNNLTGTIPTELGGLSAMQQLYLQNGNLIGSIPSELGQLSALQYLYLSDNCLTGSIPTEMGQLLEIQDLYISNNCLTGYSPYELGKCSALQQLQFQSNSLTGTMISLSGFKSLQVLNASFNLLTGEVPVFPSFMNYISLADNYFSASLADALVVIDRIQFLDLSDNVISGPIPLYFSSWRLMESLNVSSNLLSQSIDALIISGSNSSLHTVDASKNQFTGTLPVSFFLQQSLAIVLLFENCFSGSLPSDLCMNTGLQSLFLDSLTGNCGSAIPVGLRHFMHASIPIRLMQGGIPSCLWSMTGLQLLRLSGNGLTGSLGDIPTNSSLSVLVLSSNALTGSIPSSWQSSGQWSQLDLSSNKLSGLLSSKFVMSPPSTLLDLTVNRLSGSLPSVFENVSYPLNVLDGNLFQCQANHLPEQDPDHDGYVCGADDLDLSLEFALIVVCLALLAVCLIWWKCNWLQTVLTVDVEILHEMRSDASYVLSVASLQAVVTVVVYSLFKMVNTMQAFSTHTVQYTWTPSAAYLHGWAPVLLVSLLLLLTGLLWQGNEVRSRQFWCITMQCNRWQLPTEVVNNILAWGKYSVVHLMNVVVVISVNVTYVNAILHGLSAQTLFTIQFFLSVFKLVWNSLVMPRLAVIGDCATSDRVFMTLFAFIGGPFISTFFTSSNCFRNLFTGESSVQSTVSFVGYGCNNNGGIICFESKCSIQCTNSCGYTDLDTVALSLPPPWTYSYQCASSLLTNYIPVMIVTFAISGAVQPLLEFGYFSIASLLSSYLTRFVPSYMLKSLINGTLYAADRDQAQIVTEDKSMLNAMRVRLQHLLHISVLLTFGIASPLLSILIGIVAVMQCTRQHVSIGRLLGLLKETEGPEMGRTENSRLQVLLGLKTCEFDRQVGELRIVMLFAGLFWGFIVFDMIGDVYGSVKGGLSVLVPCGVSLLVIIIGENSMLSDVRSALVSSTAARQISVIMGMEMAAVNPMTLDMPQNTEDGFSTEKSTTHG